MSNKDKEQAEGVALSLSPEEYEEAKIVLAFFNWLDTKAIYLAAVAEQKDGSHVMGAFAASDYLLMLQDFMLWKRAPEALAPFAIKAEEGTDEPTEPRNGNTLH